MMDYTFSNRVSALKPSAIREIFKYAADPSVISLSAGNPSPEAFPGEDIAEITAGLLSIDPITPLQYGVTEGYPLLRELLSSYLLSKHSIGRSFDSLLITSGAQQVMNLATKSLCNSGDTIITEAPSFIGSLNTFRSYGVNLTGIPLESDGMNIDSLEKALQDNNRVRFIYIIPNFQNPSGITTSLEKRRAIYALAKQYGVLILEDNPYGDLRYKGTDIPSIKSFDEDGIVIYAGSFSKVISPGLRVGYSVAPEAITAKLVVCKQGEDVHTALLSQMICHRFMRDYDFDAHLCRLRGLYTRKSDFTKKNLKRFLSPLISFGDIEGGLFLWLTLPDGFSMPEFVSQALKRKVAVVPGNVFYPDEATPCQSFRINFSTPNDSQLIKGISLLGELSHDFLSQ
jgi:2-aminoadipate transaminase